MSTFQVRGSGNTVARIQTSPKRVFRITSSARGPRGLAGKGVPAGGIAGQRLTKMSGEDYDTSWTFVNTLYYNVKDFGATGLGTGDDYTAIQNAINQAFADGGGTVFLPAGNFRILSTLVLKARVNIVGISRWGTTITQASTSKRAIELVGGASNIDTGSVIENLAIVGSGGGTTSGIYLEASALWYINIHDVTVTGFGGNAVHIRGSVVTRLEDVTGANCGANGIYIDGSSSFVTSVSLISCFGLDNVLAGIRVEKANYTSLVSCASDFNSLGYYILDCLGVSLVSCGSEYAVVASYKIEGEVSYASHSISLNGCYAYNSKGIGYWFTGYVDATLISSIDIDPFAGSTNSLKIDVNAKVAGMNNTFINPVLKTGTYTRVTDTDGTSWLNKVNVVAITDSNGKNVMVPQATTNAVNYLTLINAATGGAPYVQADGTDSNVSLYLAAKGNGSVRLTDGSGNLMVNIDGTNKANYFSLIPSAAASALQIQALGTDTNISLNIVTKGTGRLQSGGVNVPTISSTDALSNKTIVAGSNTISGLAIANFGGITGTANSTTYLRGDGTWAAPAASSVFTGVASPTYTQGQLVYDTDNESLTFFNNDSNVALQIGQEEWIRVKNVTGSTIPNGAAIYINGTNAGFPTIALAQSNAGATTVGMGLTTEAIANNGIGYVTSIGVVRGLDTSAFTAGLAVYISATVAGGLTQTAPAAPNYRYRVGIVTVSSSTVGAIHVTPSTASLGNGTANQLFGMDNAGTIQELKTITGASGITVSGATPGQLALNISSIDAAHGGTGQITYAVGDLLYASAATTLSKLADVATGNALISGGVTTAPSWGKIGLTTHVTGTLPAGNGGTGITALGTGVATALGLAVQGSGSIVLATSPTLTTPVLGVATATSINKVTITAPTTAATLTVVDGSSLITSGAFALTLTSTATSNATIPSGTNTLYSTKAASITSAQMLASMADKTGTGSLVFATSPTFVTPILGAATATSLTMSGAVQQLLLTQTGAPTATVAQVLFINDTTTSNPTVYARSNTNFAYSGSLYTAEMVNGTDSARGFHVKNAGTGNSLQIDNATTLLMRIANNGVIFPLQALTASAPAYVKGGIYFDTTLNKLRIGGATAWETVTST